MRFHASIYFLVVSSFLNFFAQSGRWSRDRRNRVDRIRLQRELALMPRGLKMINSMGELIEVTHEIASEATRRAIDTNVYFYLYTKKMPDKPYQLTYDFKTSLKDLKQSYFNHSNPTYIITHGWQNSGASEACVLIQKALLKERDINVIVVDWESMSYQFYTTSAMHITTVSEKVVDMINFLITHGKMSMDNVTLVGHSLGAHVMGVTGYRLHGLINTVIGLDPALPLFSLARPGERISEVDAKNVEIIHTCAGLLGIKEAIGTLDFYPDGGEFQRSCVLDLAGACSHSRAYEYFAESINSNVGFYGRKCTSRYAFYYGHCRHNEVALMGGIKMIPTIRGSFFLKTNPSSPYANGL